MQTNGVYSGAGEATPAPGVMTQAMQQAPPDNGKITRPAKVPAELVKLLNEPLPPDAIQPHPTKAYLSTIKTIYIIERLNKVFGLGGWTYHVRVVENEARWEERTNDKGGTRLANIAHVVVRVAVRVPEFGVRFEQFGGNDNEDRGDAYKGAITDALGKIGGYMGIGIDVYKGGGPTKSNPRGRAVPKQDFAPPPEPPPARAAAPAPPAPNAAPPLSVLTRQDFFGSNSAGRRSAFREAQGILNPDVYATILGAFGVDRADDFKSANQAWACYEKLVMAVRDQLAKQNDPRTYEHFVAGEGGVQ